MPKAPPSLEPKVCANKKYTPPLSILHRSHIPTADSTEINATNTVTKENDL